MIMMTKIENYIKFNLKNFSYLILKIMSKTSLLYFNWYIYHWHKYVLKIFGNSSFIWFWKIFFSSFTWPMVIIHGNIFCKDTPIFRHRLPFWPKNPLLLILLNHELGPKHVHAGRPDETVRLDYPRTTVATRSLLTLPHMGGGHGPLPPQGSWPAQTETLRRPPRSPQYFFRSPTRSSFT